MTTWRGNKEGFNEKETDEIKENFSNIPLFNVLKNPVIEGATGSSDDNSLLNLLPDVEIKCDPFNIFCNDYFINVRRMRGFSCELSDASLLFKALINYITNPVQSVDRLLHNSIMNVLETYLQSALKDCSIIPDKDEPNQSNNLNDFTWLAEGFTIREGLETIGEGDVNTTIANLQKNHPHIDPVKLQKYYMDSINKLYKDSKGYVTQNMLFSFNEDMDTNKLTNPDIKKKIAALPTPSPRPVSIKYSKYMKENARFKLESSESISYYMFYDKYFPMPNGNFQQTGSAFEHLKELLQTDFENFSETAKTYFINNHTTPESPPTKSDASSYLFSLDITSTKPSRTMETYLYDIILYFSFIIVEKNNKINFIEIIPRIAIVYLTCINTVEYFKYAVNNVRLTDHEVAMFNHLFYCTLIQESLSSSSIVGRLYDSTSVPYKKCNNNKTIQSMVSQLNSNDNDPNNIGMSKIYINPGIDQYIRTIASIVCNRTQYVSNTSANWYSVSTPISMSTLNSFIRIGSTLPKECVLKDYILRVKLTNNPEDKKIIEYYFKDYAKFLELDACNALNRKIIEQFEKYAYEIKQEIYRILMIPIVIYIIYNFYYLFLFKDCFGYAKKKNNDPTTNKSHEYKKTCDEGCFFPPFPDWEFNFHKLEGHRTDFVFEFLFKPAKWIYVFLNAIKSQTHSGFLSYLPEEYPYVCFLIVFVSTYAIIVRNGGAILRAIFSLFNLEIPRIPLGSFDLNSMAAAAVWIGFIISFFKQTFGDSISTMATSATNLLSGESKKSVTWVEWILNSSGSSIQIGLKILVFILYWIFRGIVTSFIVPIAITIATIYILWVFLFGIFDYTDNDHSYFDKIELMERVMFTKMYKLPNENWWDTIENTFKTICFYCIFFIAEFVTIYTIYTTMKTFQNMPSPSVGGPQALRASSIIKNFMTIFSTCIIVLVLFWCAFKYFTKKPLYNEMYREEVGERILENLTCKENISPHTASENKINGKENTLYFDFYTKPENKDDIDYFNKNKDDFLSRIMYSDRFSSIFSEYYNSKTKHIVKRPMAKKLLDSIIGVGRYISNKVSPPKQYDSIKTPTDTLSGAFDQFVQKGMKAYKDENESWDGANFQNFFSTPNQVGITDGLSKLFSVAK